MIPAACVLGLALLAPALPARADPVQVVVSGQDAGSVDAYRLGETLFLNAQQIGSAYGSRVYWYPVAGRIQMSLRGRQMRFMVGSAEVRMEAGAARLSHPVVVRASQAFIPLDFFLSREFAAWSGTDTQFNAQTRLLSVDRRATVGPLRWFSYKDSTRVELELAPGLGYAVDRHGRSGLDVTVSLGQIDTSETIAVGDGALGALQLRQEPRLARLSIRLEPGAASWETREDSGPRRLVVIIHRSAAAPAKGKAGEVSDSVDGGSVSTSVPVVAADTTASPGASERPSRRRIVVDAGHGGKDSGATGRRRTQEKDINLLAAKELARLLKEEGAFDVLLIRDDDIFVPLDERSGRANEYQADLFISLHCNAASSRSENGFEIYFLSERASDPESQRVADAENAVLQLEGKSPDEQEATELLHAMAKTEFMNDASELAGLMAKDISKRAGPADRGVKQAAFYVLRGTNAPAVLVEMGFLTNAKDEARLQSKRFRRKLVEGIYAGVLDFAQRRHWDMGQK